MSFSDPNAVIASSTARHSGVYQVKLGIRETVLGPPTFSDGAVERFSARLAEKLDYCLDRLGSEKLGVWVLNEAADLAHWLAQPVRQLTTDRPDIALQQRRAFAG